MMINVLHVFAVGGLYAIWLYSLVPDLLVLCFPKYFLKIDELGVTVDEVDKKA